MPIKVTVRKDPPKRAEVYDAVLEGEGRDKFTRKIAEALAKGEKDEREELSGADGVQPEELPESD